VQNEIAEPSRPQEGRIERIQPIGSRQDDNVVSQILEAIDLGHKSIQHAVVDAMRFPAAAPIASISSQNITTGPPAPLSQLRGQSERSRDNFVSVAPYHMEFIAPGFTLMKARAPTLR